ncbi:MAG: hypothetical protein PCFJNLEI_03586 [Verrucomicrobiae bacterium]|nr:hypothetical protein [Verrucomicrobiae bacterium]
MLVPSVTRVRASRSSLAITRLVIVSSTICNAFNTGTPFSNNVARVRANCPNAAAVMMPPNTGNFR